MQLYNVSSYKTFAVRIVTYVFHYYIYHFGVKCFTLPTVCYAFCDSPYCPLLSILLLCSLQSFQSHYYCCFCLYFSVLQRNVRALRNISYPFCT